MSSKIIDMSSGIIDYYYEELQEEQYEPLDDENIKALFAKYRRTGDIAIRNILITHNLRLVCNVVRKYKGVYNYDRDFIKDIFQAGNIGLIRAVDLFDPEKGYKFSTYAYHCIDTEIIRLIGNSDIMKISGDKKREIYRLGRAMGKLYQKLCREPSKEELAEFLEISVEELEKLSKEFEQCVREADVEGVLKKDVEFHEKIFSMANNKKLFQLITSLWEQVHRFRVTYVSNYEASLSLVEEHNRILQAIKNGDSDLAKKYATEHIEIAEQFFMNNTVNS